MKRRRHERFRAELKEVIANIQFAEEARILNISRGGLALHVSKGMMLDREYSIKIKVKDRIVPVKGTVVWCQLIRAENRSNGDVVPVFAVGFQFKDVPEADIESIIELVWSKWPAPAGEPYAFAHDLHSSQVLLEGQNMSESLDNLIRDDRVVEGLPS